MRMGGLGVGSAVRRADVAFWASWADATEMIGQRKPVVADVAQEPFPAEQCLSDRLNQKVSGGDPVGAV